MSGVSAKARAGVKTPDLSVCLLMSSIIVRAICVTIIEVSKYAKSPPDMRATSVLSGAVDGWKVGSLYT